MSDLPDFYPGGADVVSRPEWATQEGDDVLLSGDTGVLTGGSFGTIVSYTVPAGKTLYIYAIGLFMYMATGNVILQLYNATLSSVLAASGGAQGVAVEHVQPIRIDAGEEVRLQGAGRVDVSNDIAGHIRGVLL